MAIFQNTPPPLPGQVGHDDEGIPHLNVPGEGMVPLSQQLHGDLLASPMGRSGGAPVIPAPVPSNAPAMVPDPALSNDQGLKIVDSPVARNAPAAPFEAPVNTAAQPPAMMPQIQSLKETKTEGKKIRSEDQTRLDKTTDALANAVHAEANAQAAKSNAEATLLDAHALELEHQNQQMQETEARRQAAIAERQADVDKEIEKQSAMNVDPNYFGRQDTPAKIATSIGILLSGIGAGMQGGNAQNMALEQVNKAIDRDIDAQKANIAKQGAVVAQKRGGYQDFLNATQDARAAEAAEKNRQLDIFKTRLEQVAAKSSDPIVKAAAEKNLAALQQSQAANIAQIQAVTTEQGTKKSVALGQGGGAAGVNQRIPQNLADKQIAQREALANLDALEKQLKDKKVTSYMGPVEGKVRGKALGKNVQLDTSDEAVYYNAAAKAAKAAVIKGLYGSAVSKHEQEAADSFTPTGIASTPELERVRIKQARDKVLREQKVTDDVINSYRTGKIVSGDPEPKP